MVTAPGAIGARPYRVVRPIRPYQSRSRPRPRARFGTTGGTSWTLIQIIEQYAWIGWLVLILVFLVIEMLTLDFTFLMLGVGGVGGLVVGPARRSRGGCR